MMQPVEVFVRIVARSMEESVVLGPTQRGTFQSCEVQRTLSFYKPTLLGPPRTAITRRLRRRPATILRSWFLRGKHRKPCMRRMGLECCLVEESERISVVKILQAKDLEVKQSHMVGYLCEHFDLALSPERQCTSLVSKLPLEYIRWSREINNLFALSVLLSVLSYLWHNL
jgi:hypothetical protein